jgi:hypothetical protein
MPHRPRFSLLGRIKRQLIEHGMDENAAGAFVARLQDEALQGALEDARTRAAIIQRAIHDLLEREFPGSI